ncbi:MAG: cyclic nucleotide-binding domain-containing protein [Elusimicrobia bacterium]|nr:cyclic nucleotide-binding domain-containing protein [Elusimicrobiota bacterium]
MDDGRRVELLRSLAVFSALPEERLRALAPLMQSLSVKEKRAFIAEGERGDGMYCIVSGRVRIAKSLAGGGQKDLALLGPGDSLGEMDLLRDGPRTASAFAEGPVELLCLKTAALRDWLGADPDTAARFYSHVAAAQSARLQRTSDEVALLYDLSELLVSDQTTPADLLSRALRRVTPHLQGAWSAEARAFNPFNDELELAARVGGALSDDAPAPAPKPEPGSAWLDARTRRLALRSPQALHAVLLFRAAQDLDEPARAEAERVLVGVARLLTSALENVEHRVDAALRERLRSQAHGPRI